MKTVTPTQLRADIYNLLDEIIKTGLPLEVKKGNKKFQITLVEKVNKLDNLIYRPELIQGDPDELVKINWIDEVNLDLP